ncbi:STAS domain-containing protein [Fulvimonas sp. R45]|uniref:STAS domain-containing protein n=1 Tax=Fulvimonas sp. R45 TaxID=3045937 RepID=UPI0026602B15|nr:STAS domain-containing protein [Fulvimonas sp. R45]MDO1529064.1 STAS domain-containing protein [Fulvimonas sp. R45]
MAQASFRLDGGEPGTVAVSGTLSFATAAAALGELNAALAGGRHQLDLAGVSACDSAGLACVLAVLAEAARHGRAVRVLNAPAGLRALARVCGVEPMLA